MDIRRWKQRLGSLRRFALSRQVAMAIIMVLIVAVGWLFVPQAPHKPEATGGTVVDQSHDGDAAHSAELQPARPLDLAVDVRTGRIRAKSDKDDTPRAPGVQPAPVPSAQPMASPTAPSQDGPAALRDPAPGTRDGGVAAVARAGRDASAGAALQQEPSGPQIGRAISAP